ncbi:xanthine dehydrogenase small subunit [Paracoccus aminophilus]|uniref:Xanthine dehydrogenase, small subunit n=1 Tax=Paracoccus aminophilus JCM 7686 TaxID=1367847 RepID=S5YU41_PARAH|nr:xanthine dehydrogenase small subunit [Paracoccus aminophilus]AGT08756.1 xanthine dehydrogenase, small subunit [Paracoccus aminophilus JCM 7686]
MGSELKFLLNDSEIRLTEVGGADTLLDFLRLQKRMLGTKEGCAEGDCGACTVLVGRLHQGELRYEPVNACIRFLASCHGCHIVTIEHLRGSDGGLHPVQRAFVEHHASQCGFCTPGFIMSLYGLWMAKPKPSVVEIENALQGNLCRCTGYEPIIKAALAASEAGGQAMDQLALERDRVTGWLSAVAPERIETARGQDRAILPKDAADLAQILAEHPQATIVAGATDVGLWVTKMLRPISPAVFIGHLTELKGISVTENEITLGAGVTYSEFQPFIASYFPQAEDYWNRIAGWQVRNVGTIGGNVANGSPIGETPPLLIALGAVVVLRSTKGQRRVAIEDYFIAYGKQDRAPGEFVEAIVIPRAGADRIAAYKVSKRAHSDITATAVAFRIATDGKVIRDARIAFGGMAGTPKRAEGAEAALRGQPFSAESFEAAARAVGDDFQPLSDWRATADYRRLVAANLIRRFWLEQTGDAQRLSRVE